MAEIVVAQVQSGGRTSATVGDLVVLRLSENPTTGYRWEVRTSGGLTQVGDDFVAASNAPGAGGERHLRFLVQTPGLSHIDASLRRSWETERTPLNAFTLSIEAH